MRFERGHLFLEKPGKDDVLVEVRKIARIGDVTLLIDTGSFMSYGELTMTFDSALDADIAEREAEKLAKNIIG